MNVMTICSANGSWVVHLERWVRYVKRSMPGSVLYLVWMGDTGGMQAPVFKEFWRMKLYPQEMLNRWFLNSVRMEATELFGVSRMLYVDCDCDVLGELPDCDGELGCVRSTAPRLRWVQQCMEDGVGVPADEMNNCLLWLGRSYKEEYKEAWDHCVNAEDRIRGTIAFNVMLRNIKWEQMPYECSVVWSDVQHLVKAKAIQYCNDFGQAKRLELERLWRAVNL